MPTYDYACSRCDHRFEQFQSMTARELKKCPACGKRTLQRLIGAGAGVIFKGSGFWQTDYRQGRGAGKDEAPAGPPPCAGTCGTPDAPPHCRMKKPARKR